jgi:hypothetical protein
MMAVRKLGTFRRVLSILIASAAASMKFRDKIITNQKVLASRPPALGARIRARSGGGLTTRLIRTALALTLAGAALAMAAPTVSSAASVPTRIVLYTGDGNTDPVGPAGPLGNQWTIQAAPEKITITNTKLQVVGTITEIPKAKQVDTGVCTPPQCSQWWYRITFPGTKDATPDVHMPEFYWEQPGKDPIFVAGVEYEPGSWFVAPDGAWSPRCLVWTYSGTDYYIVLSKTDQDWLMASGQACLSA